MNQNSSNYRESELEIKAVEQIGERLTGRAGLALFVSYLHSINIFPLIDRFFGSIRKSKKGVAIVEIVKQILCYMVDGTSRHLVYFDQIAQDDGYAGTIETAKHEMLSSHQVKRFFQAFSWVRIFLFRHLLQGLFIWRLKIKQPDVIELGIDTMVMNNNDALCRHGVKPTYKKVKGFQPLQMNWGRVIVDAVFRSGDKHSNHGRTVLKMIRHMVDKIRKKYKNVPIVIRMDSGFFDQKIFELCEELGIAYICGGKHYEDIDAWAETVEDDLWIPYGSDKIKWEYIEFGNKRGSWNKFRRMIYCRLIDGDDQPSESKNRHDTIIVTNLGQGQKIDEQLREAGAEDYLKADGIVACYHERGTDELSNRALKDFGHEQLPFKKFNPNAAWYYFMLIGHFIMECFKEDVASQIVPAGAYATTVRRKLIDIAGKIVFHSGKITLKISEYCFTNLKFRELFERCKFVPVIQYT